MLLRLTRYQWLVFLAAWLGWGFDVFDGLLFNYVAPNCVPTLLGLEIGSAEAKTATLFWTGLLSSMLLVGWAIGGVLFGWLGDRIGRTRTLLVTMLLYSLGTAACAFAPNIWALMAFRFVASLGIGGEWAAGASMVAEVVPESERVKAGAWLYTAAPAGLLLATFVNFQVAGVWLPDDPEVSWRYVFAFGLVPAAIAFVIRSFVKEPERWKQHQDAVAKTAWSEIFGPVYRRRTLVGMGLAMIALLTWWSCNAFVPTVATLLAQDAAAARGLDTSATLALVEAWKLQATLWFNAGGFIGTLLTIPAATLLGRKRMFAIYFALSAAAILGTFGLDLPAETRLMAYFVIGLTVFGIIGGFSFYLPELFPTRLRASASGFCFNIGRIVAAAGPFLVGAAAANGVAMQALFVVGFVPLVALLLSPLVIETRNQPLLD